MYADDTILLFDSTDPSEIKEKLEYDLQHASVWFNNNKLHLNIGKCKFMLFGTSRKLKRTQSPEIMIGDEGLEQVESYKYLGLWMDTTLCWKTHLEKVKSKIKQRIGILRRIRPYVDQNL